MLYEKTVGESSQNNKLIDFAFRHPSLITFLDAALVFLDPTSELRRRIYIMFSILEASPEYASSFLPRRFSFIETIGVFMVGIRAVLKILIGVIIIKVIRL